MSERMRHWDTRKFDVVGAGIGPANLSLAALLRPLEDVTACFFEKRSACDWHPGLLFPEATITVSYLKDLVTLADPTSRFSFLSFLFAKNRLYQFITADFPRVSRREFNQYLNWVRAELPNLEYGRGIVAVSLDNDWLRVQLQDGVVRTRNLVLGTGLSPKIPECARNQLGEAIFHATEFLERKPLLAGRSVAVIGGGQSGAEIIDQLLSNRSSLPSRIGWISRRSNFHPIDETPFANELFTPAYSNYFFSLPEGVRASLLVDQKLASDGITPELLQRIYRRLYELDFLESESRACSLYPGYELTELVAGDSGCALSIRNVWDGSAERLVFDLVIFCTGFEYRLPGFLEPLEGRLSWDGNGFLVREDFSIDWDGPASVGIYAQNAARASRGVADPNLSLLAWRSAMIANSIGGREVYPIRNSHSVFACAHPKEEETTDDRQLQVEQAGS